MLIMRTMPGWYFALPRLMFFFSFLFFTFFLLFYPFPDFLFKICSSLNLFILILQAKYPSAIASFEQIANHAKGKRIALFLDYDGTLSPIVDNPDSASMSDAVRFIYLFLYI